MTEPTNPPNPGEGVKPEAEDTAGLKKALEAERQARKDLEKQVKAREAAEADAKAKAEQSELERKGEWDKLKQSVEADLKKRDSRIQELESSITRREVERAALEAVTAADGIPKALLPHLTSQLEVIQTGGEIRVVSKSDPAKSASDVVSAWKKDAEWAWGFKGTGTSGSGAASGRSTPSGQKMAQSQFNDMAPKDRVAFIAAGGTLTEG